MARDAFVDTSGISDGARDRAVFDAFPLVADACQASASVGLANEPESHFWAIRKDDEPVLVLDIAGNAFTRDGQSIELMERYRKDRNLMRIVDDLLGAE